MPKQTDNAAYTLVSFLGTGKYEPTQYTDPERGSCETPYICAALAKLWNVNAITVLATPEAREAHEQGLQDELARVGTAAVILKQTTVSGDKDSQWQQFETLRQAIDEAQTSHILLDITHGFRAQPFFAGAVLSVLQAVNRLDREVEIVYGEFRKNESDSPIWDLSLFIELMEWAQALGLFLRTGVADTLAQLTRQRQGQVARAAQANNERIPSLKKLGEAIQNFSLDLGAVRIAHLITGYVQEDKNKHKARGSAQEVLNAIHECQDDIHQWMPPLALILENLKEQITPLVAEKLHSEQGQEAQYALARHYMQLERLPEAATVLREARANLYAQDESAVEVNSPDFQKESRKQADQTYNRCDSEVRDIASVRNDIEHGGFREQPQTATTLKNNLNDLINRTPAIPAQNDPAKGTRYLITRHSGAVDWVQQEGIPVDKWIKHLDIDVIEEGDIVIGTLPINMAAQVCQKKADYLHLSLNIPAELRGQELTAEQLKQTGASLRRFYIEDNGAPA